MEAKRVAPGADGVRRSRCAVVRNTRQMLLDSTIADWLKLFPEGEAGTYSRTELKYVLRLDDIECEVLFRGLDDANDVRRLLSLQLSFAMIDEVREINPDVFNALTGRVGRYPNGMMVPHRPEWGLDSKGNPIQGCVDDDGNPMKKIWGATNPADADSFWEQYLSNPPDNCHVTIQPSGRSPEADWLQHLPSNYYEDMAQGKDASWVSVYIDGKWGESLSGKPVWRCFDRETHVAKAPLRPLQGTSVVIGVDAGLNPSATLTQQTYDGRVMVLDSITGNAGGMGALRFCREMLKPLIANKYQALPVIVVIDPAAFQRAQTDERTVADIFKSEGFFVKPAKTNSIAARLGAVESYLTRTVNGNAALVVDPGADLLIKALAGKYRYKTNTKGETDTTPEKSHPFSDLCFVGGTPVLTPRGPVPIEELRLDDVVCAPDGYDVVVATGNHNAPYLIRIDLSDGTSLVCTPDHPFILSNTCVVRADDLQYGDALAHRGQGKWANGRWRTRAKWQWVVRAESAARRFQLLHGAWRKEKESTALARTRGLSGTTSGTTAPLRVTRSSFAGSGKVFNLTTRRTHTYYAGDALVHNCDSLQYACLHHDGGALFGGSAVSVARREVKPAPFRWAV